MLWVFLSYFLHLMTQQECGVGGYFLEMETLDDMTTTMRRRSYHLVSPPPFLILLETETCFHFHFWIYWKRKLISISIFFFLKRKLVSVSIFGFIGNGNLFPFPFLDLLETETDFRFQFFFRKQKLVSVSFFFRKQNLVFISTIDYSLTLPVPLLLLHFI